ncbi:MAG: hypothetical protein NT001_00155 [Candidatus Woesearchaeota archaeon]|nr:hypothetical protein [Candidatus Woesearchaeota archaeon]
MNIISKRSQINMMETIMVLFIFFIIVVIGFMFYSKIQESSINELQRTRFEQDAVATAENMLYMPELQCSEKSVLIDVCFDVYKLDAFSSLVDQAQDKEAFLFYQRDFGSSVVNITEIFPASTDPAVGLRKWTIYNNPPENRDKKSSVIMEIPVSLKDPIKRYAQYSIGILSIEVFP